MKEMWDKANAALAEDRLDAVACAWIAARASEIVTRLRPGTQPIAPYEESTYGIRVTLREGVALQFTPDELRVSLEAAFGDEWRYFWPDEWKLIGAWRTKTGWGEKSTYKRKNGETYTCQSSYERRMCELLDRTDLTWGRPSFMRLPSGRRYIPDFRVEGLLVEVKGFFRPGERAKVQGAMTIEPIAVIYREDLEALEQTDDVLAVLRARGSENALRLASGS